MKRLEVIELSQELRDLVGESQIAGRTTTFVRDGQPVAVLLSWDEYLATRETLAVSTDPQLVATMRKSEAEAARGAIEQPFPDLEWIRLPRWLSSHDLDEAARGALAGINQDPISGVPLLEPFRGLWSRRDGTQRVVYRIVAESESIFVLAIQSGIGER